MWMRPVAKMASARSMYCGGSKGIERGGGGRVVAWCCGWVAAG